MQIIVKGHAMFHRGEFQDLENKKDCAKDKKVVKKMIPFFQLCVQERTDTGINLVKVSVPHDEADDASQLDCEWAEVLCDLKETNYNGTKGLKMTYINGRVLESSEVA